MKELIFLEKAITTSVVTISSTSYDVYDIVVEFHVGKMLEYDNMCHLCLSMNRRIIDIRRAHSPSDTAIEVDSDTNAIRHRVVREINASLYRLSHQATSDQLTVAELITEDQQSKLRIMEEMQVRKAIETLAEKHSQLWKKAVDNLSDEPLNHEVDFQEALRVSRIPQNLVNWSERVEAERTENTELLKSMHIRKAALRQCRMDVNTMLSTIVRICDGYSSDGTALIDFQQPSAPSSGNPTSDLTRHSS